MKHQTGMALALFAAVFFASPSSADGDYGAPVACTPGKDCFLQQMADMDPDLKKAADPFCGSATYEGHTGLDIRLMSMADITRDVAVLAMADGVVKAVRDGEDDNVDPARNPLPPGKGKECGNGVVLAHGQGRETQYCHMRKGSVAVAPGQTVRRGDRIGSVGASGAAEFPHLHAELRLFGVSVDLMTGRNVMVGCAGEPDKVRALLDPDFSAALGDGDATVIAAGIAGSPVDHEKLGRLGPPPEADSSADALVGWVWALNLRQGDRVRLRLEGPAGGVIADVTGEPLDRNKASYSAFAGKRGNPAQGPHRLLVQVLRGETVLREHVTETRLH